MKTRIDVHHHAVPEFYVAAMKEAGITKVNGLRFPRWSPKASLAMMDSLGIEKAMLSFSAPGIDVGVEPADLARRCNDFLAEVRLAHPARFGGFAILPLSDPLAAEVELERVLSDLRLEGVVLLSNTRGVYLDDPRYDTLFGRLNEAGATVFIHPTDPASDRYYGLVNVFYGWFIDTARTVAVMHEAGVFARNPRITFILAHGGGALPAIADIVREDGRGNRQLRCDVAKVAEDRPLDVIEETYGDERVLFGSDFPWGSAKKAAYWIGNLEARWGAESETMRRVYRTNADLILTGQTEEVMA